MVYCGKYGEKVYKRYIKAYQILLNTTGLTTSARVIGAPQTVFCAKLLCRFGLSALQTQRLACEPITIQHNVACWSVIIANTEVSL